MIRLRSRRSLVAVLALAVLLIPASALVAQAQPATGDNPFFKPYDTPFNTPPFDKIRPAHFLPAVKEGIARQQAEIDAIVADPAAPTFANTLDKMDHSGIFLTEAESVFYGLLSANTSPEIQTIAREVAPLLTAHEDNIQLNERLFARVRQVYERRKSLRLTPEQAYLLENTYRDFVRGGALLDAAGKERLRGINQRLALLSLKFGENLLGETNAARIVIENPADLAGLPPSVVAMGVETARQVGLEGRWVYTVQVPSMIPFLQYSANRPLREQLFRLYSMRGDNTNERDNKETIKQILTLRDERSKLLGYPSFPHYVLEKNMAGTPEKLKAFLDQLWKPALTRVKTEAAELQGILDREGQGAKLAPWDWWFAAEKLRKEKYDLDDTALRPYFALERVRDGIFLLSKRLYGLTFTRRSDVTTYHPDVSVFEVKEGDGRPVGLLYLDFHPRASKRGGAWSGALRRQYYENGQRVPPLAGIVCNFTRPAGDTPSLLSLDEVTTFFHEFGHALNTLLSDSRSRDRAIPRDAVELPSQIMENWALTPELLTQYARHYQTGEVIPGELIERIGKSQLFNQGFETIEYLAAAILDLAWHSAGDVSKVDVRRFEADTMAAAGLIPEVIPRYRTTYFNHIFNGGYAVGYYVYIWAGVLDSDAFQAFREKGLFDRHTATSFRHLLAKLGALDTMTLYRRFRGAEPGIEPLLRKRGLLPGQ